MTSTATALGPAAWKALRASGSFVTSEPPAPPMRRSPRRGRAVALAATPVVGAVLLALALLPGAEPAPAAPGAPAPVPAAMPAWHDVPHPFTAYDLAGGLFAKLPLLYTARRDPAGGAREDVLTYGSPRPGEPFLRLAFLRRGAERPVDTTVFLDAARLAAGAGLAVTRSGLGTRLDTRFGPFEVAGVAVDRGGGAAECLAFRLADPASLPVLGLTGLACGSLGRPIDPVTLACTIDRLDLVSAGDDEALRAVFVTAERRRREPCAPHQPVNLRFGEASEPPGTRPLREPI